MIAIWLTISGKAHFRVTIFIWTEKTIMMWRLLRVCAKQIIIIILLIIILHLHAKNVSGIQASLKNYSTSFIIVLWINIYTFYSAIWFKIQDSRIKIFAYTCRMCSEMMKKCRCPTECTKERYNREPPERFWGLSPQGKFYAVIIIQAECVLVRQEIDPRLMQIAYCAMNILSVWIYCLYKYTVCMNSALLQDHYLLPSPAVNKLRLKKEAWTASLWNNYNH